MQDLFLWELWGRQKLLNECSLGYYSNQWNNKIMNTESGIMKCCFDCIHCDLIREDYVEGWGHKWNNYCKKFGETIDGLGDKAETCDKYEEGYKVFGN